jgi:hypothetical protein
MLGVSGVSNVSFRKTPHTYVSRNWLALAASDTHCRTHFATQRRARRGEGAATMACCTHKERAVRGTNSACDSLRPAEFANRPSRKAPRLNWDAVCDGPLSCDVKLRIKLTESIVQSITNGHRHSYAPPAPPYNVPPCTRIKYLSTVHKQRRAEQPGQTSPLAALSTTHPPTPAVRPSAVCLSFAPWLSAKSALAQNAANLSWSS